MYDPKHNKREAIKAEAERRGITVTRLGQAYSLRGLGVSVLCADLADLSETDLAPVMPRTLKQVAA